MRKRGFAALPEDKHRELSSRGGKKKGVNKGFAALTPEKRKENAMKASRERWRRVKAETENSAKEEA